MEVECVAVVKLAVSLKLVSYAYDNVDDIGYDESP